MRAQAIAIKRVSSKRQEENNHSLDQQDTSVNNMAVILEADIVKEWAMATSAKKGKNLGRKDLNEALDYCRYNKKVEYLLLAKVSRFARELKIIFYFKVEFEKLGVRLIFCDPYQQKYNANTAASDYELAREAYTAEAENEEKAHTSNTKMRERVRLGYYPFHALQGYMKTEYEDGLHVPDEARWHLLKHALKATANFEMTDREAQKWLVAQGYRTPVFYQRDKITGVKVKKGERELDLDHFRGIMKQPYYAGIIQIKGWPINYSGLHKAMITPEELEINTAIADGKVPRRKLQFNPEFRLNRSYHLPCIKEDDPTAGRLSGILHVNGKGWSRNEYVCRTCKKRVPQEQVHNAIDNIFADIRLGDDKKDALDNALRKVWRNNEAYRIDSLEQYAKQKTTLLTRKSDLINSLSANPELGDDIKEEIVRIKSEIVAVESKVSDLSNVDEEMEEFAKFAINYVENLREHWWDLPGESLNECKQLVFNDLILVSPEAKVYTPLLSPIYTLASNKKAPENASDAHLVELPDTASGSNGLAS